MKNVKPKAKPYKLADEKGLYLLITPSGGKLWRSDYRHQEKRKTLAMGKWPAVELAAARERRDNARKRLADGEDPAAADKAETLAIKSAFETVPETGMRAPKPPGLRAMQSWFWAALKPISSRISAETTSTPSSRLDCWR